MNIFSIQNLSKTIGYKKLFENFSFGIEDKDRIGVIGINGCGKSTLLKILAGIESYDEGILAKRQGLTVEYLPQHPIFDPEHTVLEHLFSTSQNEQARLVHAYETISLQLAKETNQALEMQFQELARAMDNAHAWEFEGRLRTILGKLGISKLESKMAALSGGEHRRIALAHALLSDADLLILDEPTNHLDANAAQWLESYLTRFHGAIMLVTHDRYFLDRVSSRILEIEQGRARVFEGRYTTYLKLKQEQAIFEQNAEARRLAQLKNELEWFMRGARARTTKEKARIQHLEQLRDQTPLMHRMEQEPIRFEGGMGRRLGKRILELESISKSFGPLHLINNLTYLFTKGERLGIVGTNGSGKTTLLEMIMGHLEPDSGQITLGQNTLIAYYSQEGRELDPEERVIDYVKREGGEMLYVKPGSHMSAAIAMERFHFTPQMLYGPIGKLSGGERRRMYLVCTLMQNPNFLILDEPTNDLDIASLEALEEFLDAFEGCALIVSHDRCFLDRTVERVLALEGNGNWKLYPGGYSLYRAACEQAEKEAASQASQKSTSLNVSKKTEITSTTPQTKKLSYKEKLEIEQLEKTIPLIEQRLEELEKEITESGSHYEQLLILTQTQSELMEQLEQSMERWGSLIDRT